MENDTNQIHCEDELTLQRLLDQELDADANELVFHHLQGCQRCAAIFQELKDAKSLCESQLGFEDESDSAYSVALLTRVRAAIGSAVKPISQEGHMGESGNGNKRDNFVTEDAGKTLGTRRRRLPSLTSPFGPIDWRLLLRPGTVTTLVVLLFLSVAVIFWLRAPATVSAAELLRQSAAAEDAIASHSDQVLRRTINLEARAGQTASLSDAGDPVWHRRIEIWQSADKGQVARRLFDDKDRLIAGEWKKADGSRMIFREGNKPQYQQAAERQLEMLKPESIWLLDVSAKDFSALIGNVAAARVEETSGTYLIKYDAQTTGDNELVSATLVLSKADLHTIEQTLVLTSNRQSAIGNRHWIQYRFSETSFERRTPSSVAPAVFEPDPAVLAATKDKDEGGRMKDETPSSTASGSEPSAPLAASAELEVEVLEKLNRVNAFLGEQLSLTRTPDGKLLISGIVETNERKNEILRSLGETTKNAAVRIDVTTVAEAQRRQQSARSGNLIVQDVQVAENAIPVDTELRSYLARKGFSGSQLEREIEQLSRRVLAHSARARSHALALKQIAERFSASDLDRMDQDALGRWRALIKEHAQFFRSELQLVRQELAPIFPAASSGAGADIEISNDKDIARAAKRLFELASATDNGLHRSLSLSSEGGAAPVRSPQFWQTFASAESLAGRISKQ